MGVTTKDVTIVRVNLFSGAGFKVGVIKQTETAAIKAHGSNRLGPFCRGLSALYTKATLEAAEDVGGGEEGFGSCSNYLVCVVEEGMNVENVDGGMESGCDSRIGIIAVEISTGDVIYGELNDNFMRSALEALLLRLSPAELLLGEPLTKQTEKLLLSYAGPTSNVRVEHMSRDSFNQGTALAEVISLCDDKSESQLMKNFRKEEPEAKIQAADSMRTEKRAERNAKSRRQYTDTHTAGPKLFSQIEHKMDTINKKLGSSEGLDGLDELVSGAKKSHGRGWLIGRHDPKCLKTSTSAPAPTDSYVQELTKKIRQEVAVEVEAKVNQKVCAEVDGKINRKVQDNLTLALKKLAEANPTLNVDIGEICATISSDTVGDGTPMTNGPSS
ncbi:hypothetical protein POM88_039789 [Heracleum sosnowskyi]|uniref:DNA mismatch repair protein MSH3 n=1 Tax=Heracleum sosnowskyi TaxID=360622 RepID=A0AAD8HDG9_9APIA|nr:hypothetical protein POM88_039789 [Heracleum sosnowskyi]